MAVDSFLKLDGVQGESVDERHKGEIEVLSFSWGATQTGAGGGGGGGAGKVQVSDFSFVANVSKASPVLFQKCCTGEHIKEGTLSVRKAGGTQQDYLIVKMSDCLISSYSAGASQADNSPMEQVSINFKKAVMSVKPQAEDGSLGAPVNGSCS